MEADATWQLSLVACDGSRDAAERPVVREAVEQPPPVATPEPVVDRSLGTGFELRRPIVDGRLTLVPIIALSKKASVCAKRAANRGRLGSKR